MQVSNTSTASVLRVIITGMEIRALDSRKWADHRALRLRALANAPDAFRTTYDEAVARSDEMWAETVRVTAEDPDTVIWVAEQDGTVVGQAVSRRDGSRLGIFGMWAAPEARGRGVGRALLDAAESWGRGQGSTTAYLSVTEGNSPAQRLYRRAGYVATGADEPLKDGSALTCLELSKEL